MEYDEFKESLRDMVESGLGEDYKVTLNAVPKNNASVRDALMITKKGKNISPSIYLDVFWKMYDRGSSMEELAGEIINVYNDSVLSENHDMDMFFDFENIKDHIVYKVINRSKNKALLNDVPYIEYLDLAIVFCYIFKGGELDNATILIHNSHMEQWGVTVSDLYDCAETNTRDLMGLSFKNLFDYLRKMYSVEELLVDGDEPSCQMYILSNDNGLFGAGCILYNGLLESISERVESDFFVFPCSVHEVIILPDNDRSGAECYRQMVMEINRTELIKEDVLSDSVYYYSRREGELQLLA